MRQHSSTHKVHPDRRDVTLRVGVIGEPQQQTRLSHTRVSDQQQLKQVVTGSGGTMEVTQHAWRREETRHDVGRKTSKGDKRYITIGRARDEAASYRAMQQHARGRFCGVDGGGVCSHSGRARKYCCFYLPPQRLIPPSVAAFISILCCEQR